MVKDLKKPNKTQPNTPNTINSVLPENKTLSKSRQQIYQENYQKNKERKKQQRRERYQQQKEQAEKQEKEQSSKYYGTEAIRVLMSFKEYTELNPQKHKLWLDFNWTLKDCQESIKEGFADIVAIMKLEQVAGNLIRDYWATAKSEARQESKSWNSLSEEQQTKLVKYWGYEKARVENGYLEEEERLEKQSKEYLKEIELAKFHEERGKVKCECYQCQEKKEIQQAVQAKIKKEQKQAEQEIDDYWGGGSEKEECSECGRMVKELDEENDICKRCMESYS